MTDELDVFGYAEKLLLNAMNKDRYIVVDYWLSNAVLMEKRDNMVTIVTRTGYILRIYDDGRVEVVNQTSSVSDELVERLRKLEERVERLESEVNEVSDLAEYSYNKIMTEVVGVR